MKIAVIGSGISGLATAYFLNKKHEVWLFEQNDYLGGHSHTVEVSDSFGTHKIDTGFIVCNKKTYPNFINLLQALNIKLQESKMGFSVKDPATGIEFAGQNINTIFAQRKNLFSIKFLKMLYNIKKFNEYAKLSLLNPTNLTLGEFLGVHSISYAAQRYYILPIIAAIWSTSLTQALQFPAAFLFKFLDHHGLLDFDAAPLWYTIQGGSISYVEAIKQTLKGKILLNNRVNKISRLDDKILVSTSSLQESFDKVVLAIHSDQVLDILDSPEKAEIDIFAQLEYQENAVTLHTDISLLPKERRAWASWNYFLNDLHNPNLTYNMNILQSIKSATTYCISLNLDEYITKDNIIAQYKYSHPVYNENAMHALGKWNSLNNNGVYYAGAYWGYGFHEDGLNSALRVVNLIDKDILCGTPYIQGL